MAYPSVQNFCHQCVPPNTPSVSHQREYCLAEKYRECPVFQAKQNQPMPKAFLSEKPHGFSKATKTIFWVLVLWVVVFLAAFVWFTRPPWASALFSVAAVTQVTPTVENLPTSVPQIIATATATPSPSATATKLAPTLTSTPFSPHFLEIPWGFENEIVVHQVKDGESLILLAAAYGTTVEAIRAVNVSSETFFWANTLVVIPAGQTDVSAYPQMKAKLILKEGTTLKDVAALYSVDIALLSQTNLLPQTYSFHKGEWVLIPVAQKTP